MYNMLLDRFPTEYRGYLIRTDYRIGIQITTALEDISLEDDERALVALELLYGNGIPDDINVALDGLRWFLSGGRQCNCNEPQFSEVSDVDEDLDDSIAGNGNIAYDFDVDADLIYSAMYSQYGVEIDKLQIHWFKFLAMFRSLKDTELNDLMYYRTVDTSKMQKEQRVEMRKLQDKYKIRKVTAQRKAELEACFGSDWEKHI